MEEYSAKTLPSVVVKTLCSMLGLLNSGFSKHIYKSTVLEKQLFDNSRNCENIDLSLLLNMGGLWNDRYIELLWMLFFSFYSVSYLLGI